MASIEINVNQQFDTPCSSNMRQAINNVKLKLIKKKVPNVNKIFEPIDKSLEKMYEMEQNIYRQEYAIKLQLHYLKIQENQELNEKKVKQITELEEKINNFQNNIFDLLEKEKQTQLMYHLIKLDIYDKTGLKYW